MPLGGFHLHLLIKEVKIVYLLIFPFVYHFNFGMGILVLKDFKNISASFQNLFTMRTNLLNWSDLVSISKNVVFYAFWVVRNFYILVNCD